MKFFFYSILAIFSYFYTGFSQTGTLEVQLTGIQDKPGVIRVVLFADQDGFPNDHLKASESMNFEIEGPEIIFQFENILYGDYAIAILHDENKNGKMDYNFFRMPREGFGFSNNASGTLGPPNFDASKFTLNSELKTLKIKISY
jgi:uncharacterized protein (DUF2141 family)